MDSQSLKWGTGICLIVFIIFLPCVIPTVYLGDSGELTTGGWGLAIPHVPGYPLLCIYNRIVASLPLGNIAFRTNIASAIAGAMSAALFFLLLRISGIRSSLAFAGAITLALGETFFDQSLKVRAYPLNAFFFIAICYLLYLYKKHPLRPNLLVAGLCFGVGLGNHEILLVVAPLALGIIWSVRKNIRFRNLIFVFALFLLGISVYLYLPIRSTASPILNWGLPNTVSRFLDVLLQRQYASKFFNPDHAAKWGMLKITARSLVGEWGYQISIGAFLGLIAMIALREFSLLIGMIASVVMLIFLRINYIGADELNQVLRYMITLHILFIWVAVKGFEWIFQVLENKFLPVKFSNNALQHKKSISSHSTVSTTKSNSTLVKRAVQAFPILIAILLIIIPLGARSSNLSLGRHWIAYEYGLNQLVSPLPKYALAVGGDNNVFPLWYLQRAEGRRAEVPVMAKAGFATEWVVADIAPWILPDAFKPSPLFDGLHLPYPLFFSALANVSEKGFPILTIFSASADLEEEIAWERLKNIRAFVPFGPGEVINTNSEVPSLGDPESAWRFARLTGLLDPSIPRDAHTESVVSDYGVYLTRRGNLLAEKLQLDAAMSSFRMALVADPKEIASFVGIANVLAKQGKLKESYSLYQELLKRDPYNPTLQKNIQTIKGLLEKKNIE